MAPGIEGRKRTSKALANRVPDLPIFEKLRIRSKYGSQLHYRDASKLSMGALCNIVAKKRLVAKIRHSYNVPRLKAPEPVAIVVLE